jgi:hypothetical protein
MPVAKLERPVVIMMLKAPDETLVAPVTHEEGEE